MEVPKSYFEKIIDEMKEAKGVHFDTDLTADDLKELAEKFKAVYKEAMNGEEFPQDPTVSYTHLDAGGAQGKRGQGVGCG